MESMRPALWRLFTELAEMGSITRVAAARNVAQPHISRQLGELERACGGRLFARNGRGIAPTELGHWLLPRIRAWLAETDQLESDIRTGAGVPTGEVRLAVLPSAVLPLAATVLARLRTDFPLVRLTVREGQGSQIDDWLANGRVDIAVGYRYEKELRATDEILARVDTWLVGPPGDTLTKKPTVRFRELQGTNLILPCRPSAWRDTLDDLSHQQGFALNVVVEADSLQMQRELAARGGYHTILGPLAIAADWQAGRLQASRIVGPDLPRVVALSQRPRGGAMLAQRVVSDLIREVARDTAGLAGDTAALTGDLRARRGGGQPTGPRASRSRAPAGRSAAGPTRPAR